MGVLNSAFQRQADEVLVGLAGARGAKANCFVRLPGQTKIDGFVLRFGLEAHQLCAGRSYCDKSALSLLKVGIFFFIGCLLLFVHIAGTDRAEQDSVAVCRGVQLQQSAKICDRQTSRADQSAQGTWCQFPVLRDGKADGMPRPDQNDVTAVLAVPNPARLLKSADGSLPRKGGQRRNLSEDLDFADLDQRHAVDRA